MSALLFFDTETTGIPLWRERSDSVDQPHLVSLAAILVDVDTRRIEHTLDVIIEPTDWEIPQVTIDVHGITMDHANNFGIPESEAVHSLMIMSRKCEKRVAHNTSFDNRIIRIALKRWAGVLECGAWKAGAYECTGQLSRPFVGLNKMPKLAEAYQHFFGREHDNPHTALGDATACMEIYFAVKDLSA